MRSSRQAGDVQQCCFIHILTIYIYCRTPVWLKTAFAVLVQEGGVLMHGWCAEKENRGNSYILLPIVVSVPTFCIQYSMCLYIRYLWTSPSPYITDHTMFILVLGPFEPSGAHHSMELHGCTLVPGTP